MPEDQIIVQLNPDCPPTGSCLGIVNAARKSFGRRSEWDTYLRDNNTVGYKLKEKDKRLLEFLARGMTADDFDTLVSTMPEFDSADGWQREEIVELLWQWRNTPTHDTPFNHGFFSFEVKAPIFVRAQLVKHEYLIMSEYSRRYITDDVEVYYPAVWREAAEDKKQGSGGPHPTWNHGVGTGYLDQVYETVEDSVNLYLEMVACGVAPEQARMVLPQSLMTAWTWSGTLGAFANMCKLRLHPEAQYEARLVANKVYEELKKQFPVSAKLLVEGVI